MKKINLLMIASVLVIVSACKKGGGSDNGDSKEDEKPVVDYKANTTYYGGKNQVRFLVGDLNSPIILASPHDGTLTPGDMPLRDNPNAVTVRDLNLTDLTIKIANSIKAKTGIRPHVIINDVERARMEPNRALEEAYHKSEAANALWREYHKFLKAARDMVQKNASRGLFLDMHGHGHTKKRVEVGYLISATNLDAPDATLNGLATSSSIYHLSTISAYSLSQLIKGDFAFGTLLEEQGIPAVPSKQQPKVNGDDYFNGGYCTLTYGSRSSGTVSAIQLETHGTNFRNSPAERTASAPKVADAIIKYMKNHYGIFLDK